MGVIGGLRVSLLPAGMTASERPNWLLRATVTMVAAAGLRNLRFSLSP